MVEVLDLKQLSILDSPGLLLEGWELPRDNPEAVGVSSCVLCRPNSQAPPPIHRHTRHSNLVAPLQIVQHTCSDDDEFLAFDSAPHLQPAENSREATKEVLDADTSTAVQLVVEAFERGVIVLDRSHRVCS